MRNQALEHAHHAAQFLALRLHGLLTIDLKPGDVMTVPVEYLAELVGLADEAVEHLRQVVYEEAEP